MDQDRRDYRVARFRQIMTLEEISMGVKLETPKGVELRAWTLESGRRARSLEPCSAKTLSGDRSDPTV